MRSAHEPFAPGIEVLAHLVRWERDVDNCNGRYLVDVATVEITPNMRCYFRAANYGWYDHYTLDEERSAREGVLIFVLDGPFTP